MEGIARACSNSWSVLRVATVVALGDIISIEASIGFQAQQLLCWGTTAVSKCSSAGQFASIEIFIPWGDGPLVGLVVVVPFKYGLNDAISCIVFVDIWFDEGEYSPCRDCNPVTGINWCCWYDEIRFEIG